MAINYNVKVFNLSAYIRTHNFMSGFFGRKDLLKDFCTKNGIDYKPKRDHKYKLPESFMIRHGELKFLSNIRDETILSLYERYKKTQKDNEIEWKHIKEKIKNQEEIIADQKERLTTRKRQFSATKDPMERIFLSDTIASLTTNIANQNSDLADLEKELDECQSAIASNMANWKKQISVIEGIFNVRKDAFNRNIGKKITRSLNFTHFISEYEPYSDGVKAILNGDYNEK